MRELINQKRFLSAVSGSVLLLIAKKFFPEDPMTAYQVISLFACHILGTSLSDAFGKGKIEAQTKQLSGKSNIVQLPKQNLNKKPWE
jgi:hypothetical protein